MYKRIRELREDKDLTQKQIGQILNMSQTGYNQYEIGKNDIPTKIFTRQFFYIFHYLRNSVELLNLNKSSNR